MERMWEKKMIWMTNLSIYYADTYKIDMATRKVVKGGHDIFTLAYKTLYGSNFSSCFCNSRCHPIYSYVIKRKNFHSKRTMPCFSRYWRVNLIFEQFFVHFKELLAYVEWKMMLKERDKHKFVQSWFNEGLLLYTNFRFFLSKKRGKTSLIKKKFCAFVFLYFGLFRVAKKFFWNEWGISNTF